MRDFSLSMRKNITNHFLENYDSRRENELFLLMDILGFHQNYKPDQYWRKYHNASLYSMGVLIFKTKEDKLEFQFTYG